MKERKPSSCALRRIEPKGPMRGCEDLACFLACVDFTKQEKNQERVENGLSIKERG